MCESVVRQAVERSFLMQQQQQRRRRRRRIPGLQIKLRDGGNTSAAPAARSHIQNIHQNKRRRREEGQGGWASEHTHTCRQRERESTPKLTSASSWDATSSLGSGWRDDGWRWGGTRGMGWGETEESFSCCTLGKKDKKGERESLLPPPQMLMWSSSNFTPTFLLLLLPLLLLLLSLLSSSSCRRIPPSGELTPPPPLRLSSSPPLCWELLRSVARPPSSLSCLSLSFFPRSLNAHFLSAAVANQSAGMAAWARPRLCWELSVTEGSQSECKCSRETTSS